mgnify:CR=1 FL=1
MDISPPIGIKARKFSKAWSTLQYNKAEAEWLGWSLDNKYYIQAGTTLTSGLINLPLDRMYQKILNLLVLILHLLLFSLFISFL